MEGPDAGGVATSTAAERVRCCTRCRAIYRSDFARCPTDGAEISVYDGDPLVGTTLGDHYVIEACVAEGAMGRVYRAHHVRLERRQFAVKVLLGDLASTMAMRLRFAQEAEAASRLDHPNVVSVVDYGKSATGLLYLVMEFVTGKSLSSIIACDGPMAQERVVSLARSLCLGLGHAHDRGLVHRDFKPENVIVTPTDAGEVPRILDFGLAITAGPAEDTARLTNVGVAVGTPVYAAPEQTSAGNIDQRADLFALGITLYELLAGVTPFVGNLAEVLYMNASTDLPPIAKRVPGVKVSPSLERIVRKLAHRDPDKRFGSAREVIDALERIDGDDAAAAAVETSGLETTLPVVKLDAVGYRPTERAMAVVRDPDEPAAEPVRGMSWFTIVTLVAAAALVALVILWFTVLRERRPQVAAAEIVDAAVVAEVPPDAAGIEVIAIVEADATLAESITDDTDAGTRHSASRHEHEPRDRKPVDAGTGVVAIEAAPIDAAPPQPRTPPDAGVAVIEIKRPPAVDAGGSTPTPQILDARVSIASLDLHGSLSESEVRRSVERALSTISACYRTAATRAGKSPAGTTHVTLTIDETGKARGVKASGSPLSGLDGCVAGALGGLRTRSAPDVGTVSVSLDLKLQPEAP